MKWNLVLKNNALLTLIFALGFLFRKVQADLPKKKTVHMAKHFAKINP